MIHCLSCKRYPTDVKVIPYGSDFPSDEFMVSLISKDLPNSMSISSADVVELPSGCKFAVGSKFYVVNGNDGSEVYVWNSEEFVLVESNVEPKEPDGDVTPEGEILDSWDTIIANIDNGTYSTKYSVGNYKPLDLGSEGIVNMQIVAMDADELADGSGYAPLTFVAMELLANTSKMKTGQTSANVDWETSNIRTVYLPNIILPKFPSNVSSRLQNVIKYTYIHNGSSFIPNNQTIDKIWIPSSREINLVISQGTRETTGVKYSSIFENQNDRIRKLPSDDIGNAWWTRTAYSAAYYVGIQNNGIYKYYGSTAYAYICLGFCLGLEPPTLDSITATIDSSAQITDENTLDDLKQYLTVTANYSNGTTKTVTDYTLSGTLTVGVSTITVSYEGKTTTFDVTVTETPKSDIKKYLIYTTNETNNTMTITGLNTSLIVSDQLDEIRIPDTIDGYHVILG